MWTAYDVTWFATYGCQVMQSEARDITLHTELKREILQELHDANYAGHTVYTDNICRHLHTLVQ